MKYNLLISTLLICITIEVEKKDYLKEAAHWVDIVYNKIYDSECVHESPTATTFEEIPKKKRISCSASASITYQQAGLIAKGKKVSHTASIGKKDKKSYYDNSNLKKSLLLSFTHAQNLKKGTCDFVKVMKHYDEMPDWLKQKGIMYVQDSNICVSAGKGEGCTASKEFAKALQMPTAGYRMYISCLDKPCIKFYSCGNVGSYWSSTLNYLSYSPNQTSSKANYLHFNWNDINSNSIDETNLGLSVRCLKNNTDAAVYKNDERICAVSYTGHDYDIVISTGYYIEK